MNSLPILAIDDTRSLPDASLADGYVEDCWVGCPLQASRFNLRTGALDAPPAKLPIRTHEVQISDGYDPTINSDHLARMLGENISGP